MTYPLVIFDVSTSVYTKEVSKYKSALVKHNPPTAEMFLANGDVVLPGHGGWISPTLNAFYNATDLGVGESTTESIIELQRSLNIEAFLREESGNISFLTPSTLVVPEVSPTQFDIIPGFKELYTEARLRSLVSSGHVRRAWAVCQKEMIGENGAKISNPAYIRNPKKCEAKQRRILIAIMRLMRFSIPKDPTDVRHTEMLSEDKYIPVRFLQYTEGTEGLARSVYQQVSWSGLAVNIRDRLQTYNRSQLNKKQIDSE